MGVDLVGDNGDDIHWNWHSWNAVYQIARAGGWKPAGTKPPCDWGEEWDGDYGTNDGGYVTPEDAKALAEALEKVLDPEWMDQVKEFIAFCKEGGFHIH